MNRMTLSAARTARNNGLPWLVRVEYEGYNDNNQSGRSSKFWQASGTGFGSVEIRWGRIGSHGQSTTKGWTYFEKKLYEKLGKGYNYAEGSQSQKPAPVAPKAPSPALKAAPAPKAPAVPAAPYKAAKGVSGLPSTPADPSLPGPFGLIAGLRAAKTGFDALDTKGNLLLVLTFEGGRKLSQENGVPVIGLGF